MQTRMALEFRLIAEENGMVSTVKAVHPSWNPNPCLELFPNPGRARMLRVADPRSGNCRRRAR